MKKPRTIISDIDGTLLEHRGDITKQHLYNGQSLILKGVSEQIRKWNKEGCFIVLITGRKEGCRKHTEQQLNEAGITYDILIMGATSGERVLINDTKPDSIESTCSSLTVIRNNGLDGIEI